MNPVLIQIHFKFQRTALSPNCIKINYDTRLEIIILLLLHLRDENHTFRNTSGL